MAIPFSNRSAEIKFSESALVGRPRLSRNCSEFIDDLKNQEEYWHCHCEAFVWLANNKIRVTFISSQHLEDYMHKGITFRGFPVEMKPISTKKWVRVHRLAYGIPNDAVIWALGSYGEITKIQNEDYRGANVGIRNVLMEITSPIPSQLRIRGHLCLISYRGQRRTCFRCGEPGHQKPDCPLNEYDHMPPHPDDPPPGADTEQQSSGNEETEENSFDQHETDDNPFEQHVDQDNTHENGPNDGQVDSQTNDVGTDAPGIEIDPIIRESTQQPLVEDNSHAEINESNANQSAANAAGPSADSHIDSSITSDHAPDSADANKSSGSSSDQAATKVVANPIACQIASGCEIGNISEERRSDNAVTDSNDQAQAVVNTPSESKSKDSGRDLPADKEFAQPQLQVRRTRRRTASARSDVSNSDSDSGNAPLKLIRTNSSSSVSERRRKLAPTMTYASVVRKSTRPSPVPSGKSRNESSSPMLNRSQSFDSLESINDEHYERLVTESGNLVDNRIENTSSMEPVPNPRVSEGTSDFD